MAESETLLYKRDNRRTTCATCAEVLQTELQKKNLGFDFDDEGAFLYSQWPCPQWAFAVYRIVLASYAIVITFFSIYRFDHDIWRLPWPVWLTNWSFFMLTCHLICGTINVMLDMGCGGPRSYPDYSATRRRNVPANIKLGALLFSIAAPAAFLVTIVYFSAVFPQRHKAISVSDINLHMMNSVIVLLEITFTAVPVRLLHVVYVLVYGIVYVIFSAIYWSFDHSHVMYPGVLDWNSPGKTAIVLVVLTFIGLPLLQVVLFLAFKLRVRLHSKLCRRSLSVM